MNQKQETTVRTGVVARRVKLAAALGIALAGVILAWRSLGPMGSTGVATVTPNDDSGPADAAPIFPLPASLSDAVTADNVVKVADDLTQRYKSQLASAVGRRLSAHDEQTLLSEANTLLQINLGGSFEQYVEHQRSTGARNAILDSGDAEKIAHLKSFWQELAGVVARHPISIKDAIVRPRYINGQRIDQPDLGSTTWIVAKGRYRITEDAVRGRLTVYEFIVPVLYQYESVQGPAWWGVWLAKKPGSGKWVQWRSVIYDPAAIGAGVVPTF